MRDHTSLHAWQEAHAASVGGIRLCRSSWKPYASALFNQLQRASLSVHLNIAEVESCCSWQWPLLSHHRPRKQRHHSERTGDRRHDPLALAQLVEVAGGFADGIEPAELGGGGKRDEQREEAAMTPAPCMMTSQMLNPASSFPPTEKVRMMPVKTVSSDPGAIAVFWSFACERTTAPRP